MLECFYLGLITMWQNLQVRSEAAHIQNPVVPAGKNAEPNWISVRKSEEIRGPAASNSCKKQRAAIENKGKVKTWRILFVDWCLVR